MPQGVCKHEIGLFPRFSGKPFPICLLLPLLPQDLHYGLGGNNSAAFSALKYERIAKRRGKKRAIIAIARMILTAIYSMLSNLETWNSERRRRFIRFPSSRATPMTQRVVSSRRTEIRPRP